MIRLTLRQEPPVRIAVDALIPERLAGLSTRAIAALPIQVGNRREALGDWFSIGGGGGEILFEGPCRRLDRIGGGMTSGSIRVMGDAGAYLGMAMSGGQITVEGSCGFGAATALRGGRIAIAGHADGAIGAARAGERAGMGGGIVTVRGSGGTSVGDRLKRGLIVIAGDVGGGCGSRMIAGTIVVAGRLGAHPGFAMRRGSIIALGGLAGVGATFADTGRHDLIFLRLLARTLERMGLAELAAPLGTMRRFIGDLAAGGKGELLFPD